MADSVRLRWKGMFYESDPDVQLYYVRARWYEPKTRRFMVEDPIGLAGGINPYVFADNDAINKSDPLGLEPDYTECMQLILGSIPADQYNDDPKSAVGYAVAKCSGRGTISIWASRSPLSDRGGVVWNSWPQRGLTSSGLGPLEYIGVVGAVRKDVAEIGRTEIHHLLPQAFKRQFEAAGLNIERYTMRLSVGRHRLKPSGIHTGPANWNKQWKQFFQNNRNPTQSQIFDRLGSMKRAFGLDRP